MYANRFLEDSDSQRGEPIPADRAHDDDMSLPHASSEVINPTESPTLSLLTESIEKNQGVLGAKQTPNPDSSLDVILGESRETSPVVRKENSEGTPSSSGERNGVRTRKNDTVKAVIPAALTPKPRTKKLAKRPRRRRPKMQIPRTTPSDESDDYIERTLQFDNRYRPTKRQRQTPITNSDRGDVGSGFHLGSLSLPDLRTIPQGDLTCHIVTYRVYLLMGRGKTVFGSSSHSR